MAGLERPDNGTILLGADVLDDGRKHLRPEERRLGYVAQEGNLFPHLTVRKNVGFGPRGGNGERRKWPRCSRPWVLAAWRTAIRTNSPGGNSKRVALARSLAVAPERFSSMNRSTALDATLRASVRVDVHRIVREAGATAVLVTHDQDEALLLADFVAVLRHGVIAQFAPRLLYDLPVDPDVACFVGEANLLEGVRHGGVVRTPFGQHPLRNTDAEAFSGAALVMIRPENITLSRDIGGPGLCGRVRDVEFHGPQTILRIALDGDRSMEPLVVRRHDAKDYANSTEVRLTVEGSVCAWPLPSGNTAIS